MKNLKQNLEDEKNAKGTYLLLLKNCSKKEIRVGRIGQIVFPKGFYIYSGSAFGPGGLRARLNRHISKQKKMHWHIDYIREQMELVDIFYTVTDFNCECRWAEIILGIRGTAYVNKVGSSDCSCKSHFIKLPLKSAFREIKATISG